MTEDTRAETYSRGLVEDPSRWKDWMPGAWAFYLHRLTGLVLSFYLVMHLFVLSTGYWLGHETYDEVMYAVAAPTVIHFMELGLFAAFVFHALNGTRIVLFDMTRGLEIQEQLFHLSIALSFAVVVASAPFFLLGG
ncbi:MAG: succinate dehydrogenase, cytochrome b556 subunit [Halobacteriota archaeon]